MQNKHILILIVFALTAPVLVSAEGISTVSTLPNTLTKSEKAAGWRLLWDGKTTNGWCGANDATFPANKWNIENGVLTVGAADDSKSIGGGSIITSERFGNFELMAEFKLTKGANSGIKYFVQGKPESGKETGANSSTGCEFQILDDNLHPDAKMGHDGNRTLGSLYDLIPAESSKITRPIGDWNTARILVQGKHIEHWLNGRKVVEYDRGSKEFRSRVGQSKFKDILDFGQWPEGHILLQEHGDQVHFRNLKIRVLPKSDGHNASRKESSASATRRLHKP